MLDFLPTVTFTSRVNPEVSFVVKRLSVIERTRRDASIVEQQLEYQQLLEEIEGLEYEDEGKKKPKDAARFRRVDAQIANLLRLHLQPTIIRAGVLEIHGVTLDGEPITVDQFLEVADEDLLFDAYLFADMASRLDMEALKKLASLGTSRGQAATEIPNTNAGSVSAKNDIEIETADVTSPTI